MKTPIKILIVVTLAAAVAAAFVLRNSKAPAESGSVAPPTTTAGASVEGTAAGAASAVATDRLPRLLDLGAGKCIPCKMMAPILEELKKEYAGRMTVEFIDVWVNPDAGKAYGIELIPTQILLRRRRQGAVPPRRFLWKGGHPGQMEGTGCGSGEKVKRDARCVMRDA